jgi:putative phosphoribosyl transferase
LSDPIESLLPISKQLLIGWRAYCFFKMLERRVKEERAMMFLDRSQAGRLLAEKLLPLKEENPLVLALPRGGVPVASEVASALAAPLDVLIVRKIGAPFQTELAVGALCEDEDPVWNERLLSSAGLEPDDLNRTVIAEANTIRRQMDNFREGRKLPDLRKRVVIVVDDGLATGATALAAIRFLKRRGVKKVIFSAPVAALDSAMRLRKKFDDVVTLAESDDFTSVGQWYEDFNEISDEQVKSVLQQRQIADGGPRSGAL